MITSPFKFDKFTDPRGTLTISNVQGGRALPFPVERVFWITNVPSDSRRACHAHASCYEAIIAVAGSFKIMVDDGKGHAEEYALNNPSEGILVPPNTWCELYDFSTDAVCLCLASGRYDPEGYINDYETFCRYIQSMMTENT